MMKRSITTGIVAFTLALPGVAAAGGFSLSAPILGFVFDSSAGALRPISGIPGAAVLAAPIEAGFAIRQAAISPSQNYALVLPRDAGGALVVRLDGASLVRELPGITEEISDIVLSPSGTTAALPIPSLQMIRIITGLPDSPEVGGTVDVSGFEGRLTAMAVSDYGDLIVSSASALSVAGPEGTIRPHAIPGGAFAAAFRPGSRDLAVANDQAGVLIIRNGGEYETIGNYPEIGLPNGIVYSSDGRRLVLSGASAVAVVRLEDRSSSVAPCNFTVRGLSPLSGGVFGLNQDSAESVRILDTGGAEPRVLFVPPETATGGEL